MLRVGCFLLRRRRTVASFVGASKGMGAHHRPVDIVGDVLEEARAVAVL